MALPALTRNETPFLMTDEVVKRPRFQPQPFRLPIPTRVPVGTVRFTAADAANTTKQLGSIPLIAERLIINNRVTDDAGTATKGFAVSVGDGVHQSVEIAVGGAVELLNANPAQLRVAYEGLVNLVAAEIVFVGWIAHGVIAYSETEVSSAFVTDRKGGV